MNSVDIVFFCAAGVFLFLACLGVALRCFVRITMIKAFGIDDYLMITAVILYIVTEAIVFDGVRVTSGKEGFAILPVLTRGMLDIYIGEILYVLTVFSVKLSIGSFLLRLVQRPIQKYIIITTLTLVSVYTATYLFLVIFQCQPVSRAWYPLNQGKCLPDRVIVGSSYAHSAVIGSSDLVFAILPIYLVWHLQMNKRMKFSVAGLLGVGALGGITTFIRMPYIKGLAAADPEEFFSATAHLAIWTCVEPGVAIFVGSAAALRPLFRSILGGSANFHSHDESTRRTDSQYWPSSRYSQAIPVRLNSFSMRNSKKYPVTTVVEGTLTKNGKRLAYDSQGRVDYDESIEMNASIEGGIHKTVEISATSTISSVSGSPKGEDAFRSLQGGFC